MIRRLPDQDGYRRWRIDLWGLQIAGIVALLTVLLAGCAGPGPAINDAGLDLGGQGLLIHSTGSFACEQYDPTTGNLVTRVTLAGDSAPDAATTIAALSSALERLAAAASPVPEELRARRSPPAAPYAGAYGPTPCTPWARPAIQEQVQDPPPTPATAPAPTPPPVADDDPQPDEDVDDVDPADEPGAMWERGVNRSGAPTQRRLLSRFHGPRGPMVAYVDRAGTVRTDTANAWDAWRAGA